MFLAPIFGAIQAAVALAEASELDNGALHKIAALALTYGIGWLVPALLIADIFFLKRLSLSDFLGYVLAIAGTIFVIGILLPGPAVMFGYPITAVCIVMGASLKKTENLVSRC
jgi:hypothetical protein